MCPSSKLFNKPSMALPPAPRRQQGFALIAAIFLIVVLALLGMFIVRISAVQNQTVNIALLGARAFEAARTGIEWGAFQAIDSAACTTTTLNLTEGGLDGFDVDVTCTSSTHTETGNTYNVYIIDVEAIAGSYGTPDYVSRRMQATVTDAPQ